MRLKILKVCTSRSWGGMELNMALMCEKLRARGHEVVPVCHSDSPIEKRLRANGFEPIQLDLKSYFHPFKIFKLARYIHKLNVDLIHADYSRDLWTIVPAMRLSKKMPLILLKHIGTQKPKKDFLHTWIYSHVDYIIAISNVIKKNIIETHPVPAEKVGVLYHGVDFKRFRYSEKTRQKVRAEFGLQDDEILIGIIGRLQFSKGYPEFLEMAKRIMVDFPKSRFMIVGEATRGENKEADLIISQIEQMKQPEKIIVTGFRDDIPELLAAMDLFVFPSYAEAFGLVLIEAMSMHLPVVSSNCDGVLDIVIHNETGLLVPPKNSGALTDAVALLMSDEKKRREMGAAGFRRVSQKFNESSMFDELETLYSDLVHSVISEANY